MTPIDSGPFRPGRASFAALCAIAIGLTCVTCAEEPPPEGAGIEQDTFEVELCDGHTTTAVRADETPSEASARRISGELMTQWQAAHPDERWELPQDPAHDVVEPFDNSAVLAGAETQGAGSAYGQHDEREVATWRREVMRTVYQGDSVFHDADALGSTIAVSCDMCHPNAANTHPETYPKFQVQMGRVALLRDMINWCLEHPVRAQPMAADDPRMRALEAYIYAQRRGTPLAYGQR